MALHSSSVDAHSSAALVVLIQRTIPRSLKIRRQMAKRKPRAAAGARAPVEGCVRIVEASSLEKCRGPGYGTRSDRAAALQNGQLDALLAENR